MSDGLLPLTQTAMLIRGDVAFHDYEGVAVDLDERERLVADLGDKNAMILRNHGTLAVGKNVGECFIRLYYLERACQAQIMALSAGRQPQQPAAGLARDHRRSRARSGCRWPRTCSPGRRSSARPTGSTRASRPNRFPSRKVFTCQSGKSGYDFPYWKVKGVAHGNCRRLVGARRQATRRSCKWQRRQPVRRGVTRCSG